MLDERDLQLLAQMFQSMEERLDQKLTRQRKEIEDALDEKMDQKLALQRKGIMDDVRLLLDTEVQRKFNLLAENQEVILQKLERLDDMDVMDTRISALEAMVKKLNRDVDKLKKAL